MPKRTADANLFAVEPFGLADLARAIAHPLRFQPSLVFGGLTFVLLTVALSLSALSGILLFFVAVVSGMLANMLTFGILAFTVRNFTQGRLDSAFMPAYDSLSLWDDVIHPFFLSLGVYVSSFGPFMLAAIIGAFLLAGSASEQAKKYNEELARLPGTHYYSSSRTEEQSQRVKDVLDDVKRQDGRRSDLQFAGPDIKPRNEIDESYAADADPSAGQADTRKNFPPADMAIEDNSFRQTVSGILRLEAPLVVIGTLALLWGLFYFPAACGVAARSRSFVAAVSPLAGLDTIKRLGLTYVKLLLMWLSIVTALFAAAFGAAMIAFLFNLPLLGSIPATVVGSFATFYFSIVFSCLLGYALFKSADRLHPYR